MPFLLNALKQTKIIISGIVGAVMVVGVIVGASRTLATSADLQNMRQEITSEFQKSMELNRDMQRLDAANENILRLRMQQRDYPKDKSVKTDLDQMLKEKDILQKRIFKK